MQIASAPVSQIIAAPVSRFLIEHSAVDDEVEASLRAETEALPNGQMISPRDVAGFLQLLVRLTGATRILEIGTFTGYSALKIARALPSNGVLVCCDLGGPWTEIARRHWRRAAVEGVIDLRLGPALVTVESLPANEPFDLIFIDANKKAYGRYYELGLERLRPGGLIVLDNMLWDGEVAADSPQDSMARFLRDLNRKIADDARVFTSLLSVGDGLMLAQKK